MLYDVIVLGGGPGGYNAAQRAGRAGLATLLIEKGPLGGVCLNEGCIPTKTMLYSAKLYAGAAHGQRYGVVADGLRLVHADVLARKQKVVRTLVAGVNSALKAAGVQVLAGEGVLQGKTEQGYVVQCAGQQYTAKNILLATGSAVAVPPIEGLAAALQSGFAVTSAGALALGEVPQSMVVIGGGVIGLELACYYHTAGCQVTVVELQPQLLPGAHTGLVGILQKNLAKKGMQFYLSAGVDAVQDGAVQITTHEGEKKALAAQVVLCATGRRPSTEGLGLGSIGLAPKAGGGLATDAHMQTEAPGVYAVGDVNGVSMLAHTAYREGEVAVHHMLGVADEMDYTAIPQVVYTNPEYAQVGHSAQSAAAAGMDVKEIVLPMRFSGRYLAENEGGDGQFSMLVNTATDTIVGAAALANYASEFITTLTTFVVQQTPLSAVRRLVFPHPTVHEIIREAAFAAEE